MKTLLLIVIVGISAITFGQKIKSNSIPIISISSKPPKIAIDTIKIQNIDSTDSQKIKSNSIPIISINSKPPKIAIDTLKIQNMDSTDSHKIWNVNMQWIIALIFSILTTIVNNLILSHQIKSNKETSLKQINASINADNRQGWITETRNVITELITQANLFKTELLNANPEINRTKSIYEKFSSQRIKLLLLLNPKKQFHERLINSLNKIATILDEVQNESDLKAQKNFIKSNEFSLRIEEILDSGRDLLYYEWNRVQSNNNQLK